MSEINKETRELADQARALLSSELYPAVIGGLGVYALLEYTDGGRWIDVHTVATAVIEHAKAAGWGLRLVNGFWEAVPAPVISVTREPDSWHWDIQTPDRRYSATRTDGVADEVSRVVRDNGVAVVRWIDKDTLTARRERQAQS